MVKDRPCCRHAPATAKGEKPTDKSFAIKSGEVWNTSMIAGGYAGVHPQE
jgi:hypothetical protein